MIQGNFLDQLFELLTAKLYLKEIMTTSTKTTRVDVREIPPQHRHSQIFSLFDALSKNDAIELVNDHDPQPLRHQLNIRSRNQFTWTYLESGPLLWRVEIVKTPDTAFKEVQDSCCSGGACAG